MRKKNMNELDYLHSRRMNKDDDEQSEKKQKKKNKLKRKHTWNLFARVEDDLEQ